MQTIQKIKGGRKHYHNEHYFSEPTIENCYYAGFIAADGCVTVSKGAPMLIFGVKQTDRIILERFADAIEFTGKVKDREQERKGTVCYRSDLWICNVRTIIADLAKHFNITPKKTQTLMPPNLTNVDHVKAYITGYIDGDGHLSIKKNGQPYLAIAGTLEMLLWISKWFSVWYKTDRVYAPPVKNRNIYMVSVTNVRTETIVKELLSVNVPRLERKWNTFSYLT